MSFNSFFTSSRITSLWICVALCAIIYSIFVFIFHQYLPYSDSFAYYTLLTDAFLHGKVNILPVGQTFDLSFFEGKWYLYWGASPVLFILPFFLIGHDLENDIFYTLIAGILNIGIFTLVVKEFCVYIKYSLSPFYWWIIIGSFALASPNFYLSLDGRIWHTGQIISFLYLLLFLWMFFKFLNEKKLHFFLWSLLFFHLAWLGRQTFLLYGILFFFLLKKECGISRSRLIVITFISTGIASAFFGWYNTARFHTPLETGARFQHAQARYLQDTLTGHFLSFQNIPHNIQHYFLQSPFSLHPPFLFFDPEGTSIFFVYPFTLLFLFSLFKKEKRSPLKELLPFFTIILFLLMTFLLLFFGTGWYQFGSRYFLDIIPLIFLCSIPVLRYVPWPLLLCILWYGAIINILGSLFFYLT